MSLGSVRSKKHPMVSPRLNVLPYSMNFLLYASFAWESNPIDPWSSPRFKSDMPVLHPTLHQYRDFSSGWRCLDKRLKQPNPAVFLLCWHLTGNMKLKAYFPTTNTMSCLCTSVAIPESFIVQVFTSVALSYFQIQIGHIWRDLNSGIIPRRIMIHSYSSAVWRLFSVVRSPAGLRMAVSGPIRIMGRIFSALFYRRRGKLRWFASDISKIFWYRRISDFSVSFFFLIFFLRVEICRICMQLNTAIALYGLRKNILIRYFCKQRGLGTNIKIIRFSSFLTQLVCRYHVPLWLQLWQLFPLTLSCHLE